MTPIHTYTLPTIGPWHVGSHRGIVVYDKNGQAIADAKTYHGKHSDEQQKSNARLIAAAPDLLSALTELLAVTEDPDADDYFTIAKLEELQDKARKAINKATGKEIHP